MDRALRVRISVSLALLVLSLGAVSCAKHDEVAERNAEIDRRIDERLAAREEAAARQRLAQQQADLTAREKVIETREASFATLVASTPETPAPEATEPVEEPNSSSLATESYPAPQTYSTYPETTVPTYTDPYSYVGSNGSFYSDPYFYPPSTTFVSVINQTALVVNPRRRFRRSDSMSRRGGDLPARPTQQSGGQRPPVVSRPPMMAQQPPVLRPPIVNRRPPPSGPVRAGGPHLSPTTGAPQVATRRAVAKPVLPQTP